MTRLKWVKFFFYYSIATEQQAQQNEVGAGDSRVDNTLKAGTESQETLPPEVVNVSRHLSHDMISNNVAF